MRTVTLRSSLLVCTLAAVVACSRPVRVAEVTPEKPASLAELWQEPADLATRDLYHGPGGKQHAPPSDTFEFVAEDTTGHSPGFDV